MTERQPAAGGPSDPLWREVIARSGLQDVAEKVVAGERLTAAEGVQLYQCADLNAVGLLANLVRERLNGKVAYYVRNQHLNYTNVCSKRCRFCSFYARDGGHPAYTLSLDEVRQRLRQWKDMPLREVHIVGGINPELPYAYYLDLLRTVKEERPTVHVKAFTMVELEQIVSVSGKSLPQVFDDLRAAGLNSFPGGGAEILSPRLHRELHPRKLTGERWLELARAAHRAGFKSTATMLYGHEERVDERVEHLLKLRALQDETGGFQCFVPLSFHPDNTELAHLPASGGVADLKNVAVPRLLLDNFPHVKSFWIMTSVPVAQVSLRYGADDLDGTIQEYQVTRDPQTGTRQSLTQSQLLALIAETGREAVERDALYRPLSPEAPPPTAS